MLKWQLGLVDQRTLFLEVTRPTTIFTQPTLRPRETPPPPPLWHKTRNHHRFPLPLPPSTQVAECFESQGKEEKAQQFLLKFLSTFDIEGETFPASEMANAAKVMRGRRQPAHARPLS